MAKDKKDTKKKNSKNDFAEFEFEGNEFKYTGRIYTERQKKTKKCTITPFSLTINGLITIKGCKLFVTDKNKWIQGPQYEYNDEYNDYMYIAKELYDELDDLCDAIEEAIDD